MALVSVLIVLGALAVVTDGRAASAVTILTTDLVPNCAAERWISAQRRPRPGSVDAHP
jgi:hypothetical protein